MVFKTAARASYYLGLQAALRGAGIVEPVLVLDKARLRANLEHLKQQLPAGMALRIASKSLPVPELLRMASERLSTHSYMTFNVPMLGDILRLDPGADQLLGKPLPVAAMAQHYAAHPAGQDRVTWLIDTLPRLQQCAEFAKGQGRVLNVAFEIDIGLHRGGFQVGPDLRAALDWLGTCADLSFKGFMGYDAYLSKVPTLLGLRARQIAKSFALYRSALDLAREVLGLEPDALPIRNAAGSPTFRMYGSTDLANEMTVGSALVKATDFDTDLLGGFQPALFIATPALKVLDRMRTPVLEPLDGIKRLFNPGRSRGVFIHGGNWKAQPEDPPGLSYNPTYGRSSNQELLNAGPDLDLSVDDFVFLRPTQSETVMLQFGDIAVYDEGRIVDRWSPFDPSC